MNDGVAPPPWAVRRWGVERLGDLTALCAAALPDERLLAEDLEACCFDDPPAVTDDGRVGPSVTFGVDDGDTPLGAVAVAIRHAGDLTTAHVQVLVVEPGHRRRGVARALVGAAEAHARDAGAVVLVAGGGAPFYLFTGVDHRWWKALCCLEALGWQRSGAELDLECLTRPGGTLPSPPGVTVAPVRSDGDVADLVGFARRSYPHWEAEFGRGGAAGTAVVARVDGGGVVGAAAHSVNRFGVVGPVAVDPAHHTGGIGTLLVRAVLADLAAAGCDTAEIAWTSTVRFYAEACGATVGRVALGVSRLL